VDEGTTRRCRRLERKTILKGEREVAIPFCNNPQEQRRKGRFEVESLLSALTREGMQSGIKGDGKQQCSFVGWVGEDETTDVQRRGRDAGCHCMDTIGAVTLTKARAGYLFPVGNGPGR